MRLAGLLLVVLFALAGCKQALFSQLSEHEANEVFAALSRTGIGSQKVATSDKLWGIEIAPDDIPAAVEALNRVGLPRSRFANLGEMFKREGIVSTPTEERVRFLYGVSQELSQTLSTIDGVTAARVHIVIPQNDPLADKARPSSASVFVKHRAELDLQPMLSSIKSLVLRSVEGLTHDTVFVSFFPAEPPLPARGEAPYVPLLGLTVPRALGVWLTPLLWLALIGMPLVLGYLFYRYRTLITRDLNQVRRRRVPSAMTTADGIAPDALQPLATEPAMRPPWDGLRGSTGP